MVDLRAVNRLQFDSAKAWWTGSVIAKLIVFILGILGIVSDKPSVYLPQYVLLLAVASEIMQIRSDGIKGGAEALLRTLDMCQSFGREISAADKRDIIYAIPRSQRKHVQNATTADQYFGSLHVPGPRKAVENLIESAWYTRHQAKAMAVVYASIIAVLFLVSLASLIVAVRSVGAAATREEVIKLVTSLLLLVVSLNMLKGMWSYIKLRERCAKTELTCEYLLRQGPVEPDALKQWHEYQLTRAASPLFPKWLWKVMEGKLNQSWATVQREQTTWGTDTNSKTS